jgi:hypothetical protein
VLKNSFALSAVPASKTEYVAFVVVWPCFRALLDRRPGRQLLFQQADEPYSITYADNLLYTARRVHIEEQSCFRGAQGKAKVTEYPALQATHS